MRSIIDEIAVAEEQAEQIRQNAALQAREETAKAREQAQQALAALAASEREATERATEQAHRQGEQSAKETLSRMESEADDLCARANEKVELAVAYLVNRIVRPAGTR